MLAAELQRIARQSAEQLAPDDELLRRFAGNRDESAFAELVRRHGSLVLGVGRRLLGDHHAAEDILQATFFLLARKADQIRWQRTIAPWLYFAAYRIAMRARRRRRVFAPLPESVPSANEQFDPARPLLWSEVRSAIDEELIRMSGALRAPLVLCYMQGRTRDEAAQSLGLSLATLKRRLERGRNVLRARLTRRGITLSAAGTTLALEERTLPAATAHEIAKSIANGSVSSAASALVNSTFTAWRKLIAVSLLAMLGLGGGLLLTTTPEHPTPTSIVLGPEKKPDTTLDVSGDPMPDGAIARLGTTRLRPGGMIPAMAFSPDGKQLAVWAEGRGDHSRDRLIFADPTNGRQLKSIPCGPSRLISMQWLADGRGFALMKTELYDYYLWEFTDANSLPPVTDRAFQNGHSEIFSTSVSPDGRWLAVGLESFDGKERPIELWEVKPNSRLRDLKRRVLGQQLGHGLFVEFSADGKRLFALSCVARQPLPPSIEMSDKARLVVYELPSGNELKAFDVATPTVSLLGSVKQADRVALSPDAKSVLIGDEKGTVHVYDWAEGRETSSFVAHPTGNERWERGGVNDIMFSPDGQTLYTASRHIAFAIRDPNSGATRTMIHETARGFGKYFAMSRDGKQLAVADSESSGGIELRNPTTGELRFRLPGHAGKIDDLTILPDGIAMTGSSDFRVRWWNLSDGRELKNRPIEFPTFVRRWSSFTPDGRGVFGWKDNRLLYVDLESGKQSVVSERIDKPWNQVLGVSGSTVFYATEDGKIGQWDARTGSLRRTFEPRPGVLGSRSDQLQACMSQDESKFAVISQDSVTEMNVGYMMGAQVSLYNAKSGQLIRYWHTAEAMFWCANFSADGRFLCVGASAFGSPRQKLNGPDVLTLSPKSGLLLFDAETGEPIRGYEPAVKPPFGSNYVRTVAISPNGQLIADERSDNSIAIHELATGEVCRVFRGHHNTITHMAFTPDSRRLVSVSDDTTGLVWDVSYSALSQPTRSDPDNLWSDLDRSEWVLAGPALATFAKQHDALIALVKSRLPAAEKPDFDPALVARWAEKLDVMYFDDRRRAQSNLEDLGRAALPVLRERVGKLKGGNKRELEQLIERISDQPIPASQLRQTRAVALLAQINSREARRELERLAAGHPQAQLTRDAKAALKVANP